MSSENEKDSAQSDSEQVKPPTKDVTASPDVGETKKGKKRKSYAVRPSTKRGYIVSPRRRAGPGKE